MKFNTENLTKMGLVAALYVALTLTLQNFSYGPVQFRIAEILNLLAFFNPIYILAITIGCFFANLFSSAGPLDVIFGTLHTFLSLFLIWKTKNIFLASLWPAILSFIIALMLIWAGIIPSSLFLTTYASIALSEFIICSLISLPVISLLLRNKDIARGIVPLKTVPFKH